MIQFGDQKALMVLGSSALGDVYVYANHATRAPAPTVANKGSCFDPLRLAVRPNNAKLANKFRLPFSESLPTFSAQPRKVVWLDERPPVLARDLSSALRQAENRGTSFG